LVPLFDAHGVDIVFMGHDHHYERTVPLRGDAEVPLGEGTVYMTTGGGGASLRAVEESDFTAYSESTLHVTHVSIDGGTLHAEMVVPDGAVRDAVTLSKGGPEPCQGDCCTSDAACDDQRPCTVDRCDASGRCSHIPMGLETVRAALAQVAGMSACEDEVLPRRVTRRISRAMSLLGRVERTARSALAARFVRRAEQKLLRASRAAERAGQRETISADCAAGLVEALESARFECVSVAGG
jgi:hypothetical protein